MTSPGCCPCGLRLIQAWPGSAVLKCPLRRKGMRSQPVVVGPVPTRVSLDAVKGYGGAPEVSAYVLAAAALSGEVVS